MSPSSRGDLYRVKEGVHPDGHPSPRTGASCAPSGPWAKSTAAPPPLPASVTVLNQSSSFSKQVSSARGCLGSARAAQRAGSSWEHSGSMAGPGPCKGNVTARCRQGCRPRWTHSLSLSGAGGRRSQAGRALRPGHGAGRESVWRRPRGLRRSKLPTWVGLQGKDESLTLTEDAGRPVGGVGTFRGSHVYRASASLSG